MHRYMSDEALIAFGMKHDKAEPKQRRANDSKHKKNYRTPRTETVALTDCLVTRADGTQYVMSATKTVKTKTVQVKSHAQMLHERMMALPTIHPTV